MNSFELNKIAGAIFGTLLIYLGIQNLGDFLFHTEPANPQAYIVEGLEDASTPAAASTAPQEETYDLIALISTASLEKGAKVAKKCIACHAFEKGGAHKIGPALYDVVNRAIGKEGGFSYSKTMANMGGVWDYAALDAYLLNPKKYAPGTKMAFIGLKKPADRAAIIAYLRAMADTPAPLGQ